MSWYDDTCVAERSYNATLLYKLGANEALFLCQIMYWLKKNKEAGINFRNGRYWTYNTYQQWKEQFPRLSEKTFQRMAQDLRDKGLLIIGKFNKNNYDQTRWYSVDYERISELIYVPTRQNVRMSTRQNVRMSNGQNVRMESDSMSSPIPENILRKTYREYDNKDMVANCGGQRPLVRSRTATLRRQRPLVEND